MIIFLRCSPVNEDIRLSKYIQACKIRKVNYIALTWDRLGKNNVQSNEIQFKRFSEYGKRWRNLNNKIMWQFFLIIKLFHLRKKYKVIHATNFDTIIPAYLIKLFLGKKMIYDVYDYFSSDFLDKGFGKLLKAIDKFFIRKSDVLILADIKRTEQMNIDNSDYKKLFVVENVPNISFMSNANSDLDFSRVKLGYVGVFDILRGLEELMHFVSNDNRFILNIAGTGTLVEKVKHYAEVCSRINYLGVVGYDEGLRIMNESDFIIGMYYKAASNHIYAAPNKFFESLFLSKPLITTIGTLVGEKVDKYNTGYAIEEGENEIMNLFNEMFLDKKMAKKKYDEKVGASNNLWNNKYKNYFDETLKSEYVNLVIDLIK